jgi:hypothetical protein
MRRWNRSAHAHYDLSRYSCIKRDIQVENIVNLGGMRSDADFGHSDESSATGGHGELQGVEFVGYLSDC